MADIPLPVEEPGSLTEYAAADAARGLVDNWRSAVKDDPSFPVETMASDIDEVIELLKVWKNTILAMRDGVKG